MGVLTNSNGKIQGQNTITNMVLCLMYIIVWEDQIKGWQIQFRVRMRNTLPTFLDVNRRDRCC